MGCNRENVVWPREDGKWSIGFYDFYETGDSDDEDFDYEWDVDYDFGVFHWVSTGHASQRAATDAWNGADPGGHSIVPSRDARFADECARLDAMLADCQKRMREQRQAISVYRF